MLSLLPFGCMTGKLGTYDLDQIQRLLEEGHSIIVDDPNEEEMALFYLDQQNHTIRSIAMSDWTTNQIASEELNYEYTMKRTFPFYHLKRHRFYFAKVKVQLEQDAVEFRCETHAV